LPVDPATSKEAVMHHALAKQKKADYQRDYKQEPYNCEPARLWSCKALRIRISCHRNCVSSVFPRALIADCEVMREATIMD